MKLPFVSRKRFDAVERDLLEIVSLSEAINTRLTLPHGWTIGQIEQHREDVERRYKLMEKYLGSHLKRMGADASY